MYRQVPGGVQQVAPPRAGPIDDLVADLLARSQDALCVGDGALRYRAAILDGFHCEIADDAHPSAGPLVQLAHARALREDWVSPGRDPAGVPAPAGRPDQLVDAGASGRGQDREHPCPPAAPAGRRRVHDRADAAPTPRPGARPSSRTPTRARGRRRCSTTSSTRCGSADAPVRRRPHVGGRGVVGYAGLMFVVDEAHVTNIAVHAEHRRPGIATELLLDLVDMAIARGAQAWTLEVRASSNGAQALYRRFGFVPAGVRARYYESVEDAIVMWCHDIQSDAYARRLDRVRSDRWIDTVVGDDTARARHRDELRRDGGGARHGRQRRRVERRSARRSSCTPSSAASCRRSPAAPTSTCSTR